MPSYDFYPGDRVWVSGTINYATVEQRPDFHGLQVFVKYDNGAVEKKHAMFLRHVRPDEKESGR